MTKESWETLRALLQETKDWLDYHPSVSKWGKESLMMLVTKAFVEDRDTDFVEVSDFVKKFIKGETE